MPLKTFFSVVLLWLLSFSALAEEVLTLGVYAYRDPVQTKENFQPFVDYLNQQVKGFKVDLKVLNNEQLKLALRRHQVDLLIVNPSLYEIVRNENSLSGAIATVQRSRNGYTTTSLGGVVFSLAERKDLKSFQDLKHLTIAVPSTSNMGAYRIPIYEIKRAGVSLSQDSFIEVSNNDSVVQTVLSGKADVGFVRTGILESWIDEGRLKLSQIRVINQRQLKGFPYLLSTGLYPEWPFVVLSNVKSSQTRQLILALFNLKANSTVAKDASIAGFVPPLDYLPVQNLLRDLHLPPYDQLPEFSWTVFWNAYQVQILLFLILILILISALFWSSALSANLRDQSKRLAGIITATRSGSWEWEIETGALYLNERWAEILGYKLSELEPISIKTWQQFVHPDDLQKSTDLIQKHFEGKLEYYEMEVRMRHREGYWIWVLDRGKVIKWSKSHRPLKMSGTHIDITKIKSHEELLRLNGSRDALLLKLPVSMESMDELSFLAFSLTQIENLTQSSLAFVRIIHESLDKGEASSWWTECTYPVCKSDVDHQFSVDMDSVSHHVAAKKIPIILNDVGTGESSFDPVSQSFALERYVIVPIIDEDHVVMIFGLGNKLVNYEDSDVESVRLIGNEVWRLIERSRIHEKAQKQQKQYQRLVKEIGDNFVVFSSDVTNDFLSYISDSVETVFGIKKREFLVNSWAKLIAWTPESLEKLFTSKMSMAEGGADFSEIIAFFIHPSGEKRAVKVMGHAVRDVNGVLVSIEGLIEHVTEKLKLEHELKQAASVFEYAQEGIMITDAKARIVDVNEAFIRITGYEREEVIGKRPSILKSGRQSKEFYADLWKALLATGQWNGEIWNRRKDGEEYPERVTISSILDDKGVPLQYIALFSDISVQKQQQAQLEYNAHFDGLTGLPNRTLLTDRISQAMAYSNRHKLKMAVVFIDLDGFKAVNDLYGHQAGDKLLVEIAKRFKHSIRESDTIARLGGDEFVAVLSDFRQARAIEPTLERLLDDANRPVNLSNNSLGVSASIGVCFYRHGSDLDADQLMRQADQAMYQAKLKGKNQIYIFNDEADEIAQNSDYLALEKAIPQQELSLYYQPKVNMRTGEVLGFEALIRWQHPLKGFLLPAAFLPLLKGQALNVTIGFWVIETAIQQMCAWQLAGKKIAVSVNVEGNLLQHPDFVPTLTQLLERYPKVLPNSLTLEVLESSAIEDIFSVSKIISECRRLGVHFSLDDFGTGYASLTYLKNLPVNELKIDRSFIKDLSSDLQGLAIMQSLVGMGKAFNLTVIAEGVETDEQANALIKLGYEWAQGFRIAHPMKCESVLDWLEGWQRSPAWQSLEQMHDVKGLVLVAAIAEHKAWVSSIKRYIEDESTDLPPLHPSDCKFGKWLDNQGAEVLEYHLNDLSSLHHNVHEQAEAVVALKESGQIDEAKQQFKVLNDLKEQVVNKIETVIKERLAHQAADPNQG